MNMKYRLASIIPLFVIGILWSNSAHSYDFLLKEFQILSGLIAESLQAQAPERNAPADAFLCGAINQSYLALPRNGSDTHRIAEDLFEMKFAMHSWRTTTKETLLHRIQIAASPHQLESSLTALTELGIQIHADEMDILERHLPKATTSERVHALFMKLIARSGELGPKRALLLRGASPEVLTEAGPLEHPKMIAAETKEVPFSQWAKDPAYGNYERLSPTSVSYRGIDFQSGDFILVDEARPIAGFMPAFFIPRQNTNHFAIFAIREVNGSLFPIVYDFADTFRIIPLNLFVSEHFCTSANVLRHKDMTSEMALRADAILAKRYQSRSIPFNMASIEGDEISKGLTCGTFSLLFLRELGLELPTERSTVEGERIEANLDSVRYDRRSIFAPVNMFQSRLMNFVGTVDNGFFGTMLVRSLINHGIRSLMYDSTIQMSKFGPAHAQTIKGISMMRETGGVFGWKSLRSKLLMSKFLPDHTRATFPGGDAVTLATYKTVFERGTRLEMRVFKKTLCAQTLTHVGDSTSLSTASPHPSPEPFSFQQFSQSEGPVQNSVRQHMTHIASLFSN